MKSSVGADKVLWTWLRAGQNNSVEPLCWGVRRFILRMRVATMYVGGYERYEHFQYEY